MIVEEKIAHIYSILYSKVYGNKSYTFKYNEKSLEKVNDFLVLVNTSKILISDNFLIDYFLFHLNRIDGQNIVRYSSKKEGKVTAFGKMQIYDFISIGSFQKWKKRDTKFDYNIRFSKVIVKYKIKISELKINKEEFFSDDLVFNEEIEKKRFLNKKRGLLHCFENTSLINKKSDVCNICIYTNDCLSLLNKFYPDIYCLRYGKSE